MEYFEKAVVGGKVKRSLKSVACLRNDCFGIFPNQGKWDGGSHPAFIVFYLPCKTSKMCTKQVFCYKPSFPIILPKFLFQVRQPILGGALVVCIKVGWAWTKPDSWGTGSQCKTPATTLWIKFLAFLAPTPRYFLTENETAALQMKFLIDSLHCQCRCPQYQTSPYSIPYQTNHTTAVAMPKQYLTIPMFTIPNTSSSLINQRSIMTGCIKISKHGITTLRVDWFLVRE